MMFCLAIGPKFWAKQPWMETSKTMSQKYIFLPYKLIKFPWRSADTGKSFTLGIPLSA
jgi:hypothetical protein